MQGVAKEDVDFLAWKCPPGACEKRPARWITLQEQCRYRIIIHLPGVSDWLEHFKHQLACGSVNIFIGPRPPKQWAQRKLRMQQLRSG